MIIDLIFLFFKFTYGLKKKIQITAGYLTVFSPPPNRFDYPTVYIGSGKECSATKSHTWKLIIIICSFTLWPQPIFLLALKVSTGVIFRLVLCLEQGQVLTRYVCSNSIVLALSFICPTLCVCVYIYIEREREDERAA